MTNYNDGNFHGWNGGECPVHPKSVISAVGFVAGMATISVRSADAFDWETFRGAFRVNKEHKEPREWWIDGSCLSGIPRAYSEPQEGRRLIHVREVMEGEE